MRRDPDRVPRLLAACQVPGSGIRATAPAATSHTVSLTAAGRTRASLDVLSGTTVLTIGTASFGPGGSLLTVTTPAGTPVPQLSASDPDGGGNGTLVDLRGGQLSGISFKAGSSLVALALPQPHGSVPVQMVGRASAFQLSLPAGVPARVTAGGASEVSLEGQQHTGVAGGSVFTTAGWEPGVTGFDIDAMAGVSQLTVTARSG